MQQRNEQQHALEQLEHDAEVLAVFVDAALSGDGEIDVLAEETAQRLGGWVDVVDGAGRTITSTDPARAASGRRRHRCGPARPGPGAAPGSPGPTAARSSW